MNRLILTARCEMFERKTRPPNLRHHSIESRNWVS